MYECRCQYERSTAYVLRVHPCFLAYEVMDVCGVLVLCLRVPARTAHLIFRTPLLSPTVQVSALRFEVSVLRLMLSMSMSMIVGISTIHAYAAWRICSYIYSAMHVRGTVHTLH